MRNLTVIITLTIGFAMLSYGAGGYCGPGASQRARTTAIDGMTRRAGALLSLKCLSCHNDEKRAGGIDLSTKARALSAGVLSVGGRMERAVTDGRMPPTGKLPASEQTLIRSWLASGAKYPEAKLVRTDPAGLPLWSFQPVKLPAIPRTAFDSISSSPIDRFIFATLARHGLRPSPLADKRALIRRVTIDLIGLPPTPSEIAAFVSDDGPAAYEKVVDRLLASPAYGERWGRHWLDVVRYGESNGYEQNHLRPNAWPYRDYVIKAFNDDKRYTDFIAEQLAGDALAKGDRNTEAATGFLVAGIHDTVGIQEEQGTRQQRANDLDDVVSTTGAAFLGLTVGCAKCHDHKFDPIPQRDFYRLAACFAGVRHGERPLGPLTTEQAAAADAVADRISALNEEINKLDSDARAVVLRTKEPASDRPAVGACRNEDSFPAIEARFIRFTILATKDGAEPCLDELQVYGPGDSRNLALSSAGSVATASSLLPGFGIHRIEHLNDGKFGNDWSWISATRGTGWAQIELGKPAAVNRVVWGRDGGEIPRFDDRLPTAYRIEVSSDGAQWKKVSSDVGRAGSSDYIHPDALRNALTEPQRKKRDSLRSALDAAKAEYATLNSANNAYVGQFTAPDPIYLLRRGDVMQRLDQVSPGPLSKCGSAGAELGIAETGAEPERRLALARWIGSAANPLTARVIVNRIWQGHFGRGIVGTPSDFGRNGERPSHPELLDWLASEFMAPAPSDGRVKDSNGTPLSTPNPQPSYGCGWRMKKLHRLIVTSYAYRQTSTANPTGVSVDAGNLFLWRAPLQRMDAESIRDAILQTSGKLDRKMGGPSYLLYKYRTVNVAIFEPLQTYGPETWRRSVYQQAARGIHDELLSTFDCPESSQRAPKRDSTTTALQSLAMLNGPFIQQQAAFFADRVKSESDPSPRSQIRAAFMLAFGRQPTATEARDGELLVSRLGLAALCRALMNANEFIYY